MNNGTKEKEWYKPEDIAEKCIVHPETVRIWLRKGYLKGSKLGSVWRIYIDDYQEFIDKRH